MILKRNLSLTVCSILIGSLQLSTPAYSFTINCSSPVWKNKSQCVNKNKTSQEKYDVETGMNVVVYLKDLDWKSKKAKLPWSQVVKLKSQLDGTYELVVFHRDYITGQK